ncbi:sialin-like isoform X1 [Vespa velutina]|uniref:sialin-like isoform X1 n=2 Tax=Vespa velutina TaxID=202808 RepID=UPI001FB2314E|nr:sialin-like isoform X1 [Vespa velutina]
MHNIIRHPTFIWKLLRWIPTRILICLMMFTCCWTSYMCRLQMPILAVPMIKALPTEDVTGACFNDNERQRRSLLMLEPIDFIEEYIMDRKLNFYETKEIEGEGERFLRQTDDQAEQPSRPSSFELFNGLPFDWSPHIRGQLIAAYGYGYLPGCFLGGLMALKWGPRKAILWTSVLAAFISLITPILAQIHWGALVFARMIIGLTGGVTFPACHTLVAKWAPPDERARFVWSLLGGTFGTVFTYPMVAAIADYINWESAWYIPSVMMFLWIIFWALLTFDSPMEHPGITEEEKEYILNSQAGIVRMQKPTLKQTPIKQIFTSIPFISLVICHFGNLFLLFFYQNSLMLYMTKALGFQLTKGGTAAGLPWAGRMLFGFFFCWAGDNIKKKQLMSVTKLRKCATIFSHLLPGIFLILVGYAECSLYLANVFLFFALGFNGAASIANLSNNQDISPNFAGFLYGIMNTVGSVSSVIIPTMVEEIAGKYGNPIHKWRILFWIGAGVCILSMVIFIIGGSGEIQKWNEIKDQPDAERGKAEAGTT